MALTRWQTFQTNNPSKAQQLTQVLLAAKGTSDSEIYLVEVNPSTGAIPVTSSESVHTRGNVPYRRNYAIDPVDTTSFSIFEPDLPSTITLMQIFDSSGQTMEVGVGDDPANAIMFMIPPGGIDINAEFPPGTKFSIRAVSADAIDGELVINYWA